MRALEKEERLKHGILTVNEFLGINPIFGVVDIKPIRTQIEGRVRIRMRQCDFAKAFVKTERGLRLFYIMDHGEYWTLDLEQGRNERINYE